MAKRPQQKALKLTRHTRLGEVAAENDKRLLPKAFYETPDYTALRDVDDPRCFVVGRTGVGKSALLTQLRANAGKRAIQIAPKSLALEYITGRQVAVLADELGVNIEPLYVELWKHVIVTAVLRQKFESFGETENPRWTSLVDSLTGNKAKAFARQYLIEYKDEFWKKTDEIVKSHFEKIERRVEDSNSFGLGVKALAVSDMKAEHASTSTEVQTERVQRFKQVVGETQLATLNEVLKVLDDDILSSDQAFYVVIDDLDEDWVDEGIYRSLMMALFRTVKELASYRHLKVIIAVRTNILAQLDFESPTSAQWEKYEGLFLHLQWTKTDLVELLDQRVDEVVQSLSGKPGCKLRDILPQSGGSNLPADPVDYVLDRTLMRPRDALAFLNEALSYSDNDSTIKLKNLKAAEPAYSRSRLKSLHDEWKLVHPHLPVLTDLFAEGSQRYSRHAMGDLVSALAIDFSEASDTPVGAMFESFLEDLDVEAAWSTSFLGVVRLLFEVGFLGINFDDATSGYIYSQLEPRRLDGERKIGAGCRFEVHQAFWSALGIKPNDARHAQEIE